MNMRVSFEFLAPSPDARSIIGIKHTWDSVSLAMGDPKRRQLS
jgi:hypothetical protein